MKPIHVAATIVRLFSICLAIYSCTLLMSAMMFSVGSDVPVVSAFSISFPIAFIIISIVMWNFPISISRKITGIPPSLDDGEFSINADEFLSISLFSLGIYFLYSLLGDGAYWINYFNDLSPEFADAEMHPDAKAGLWSYAVRLVFTIFLLAGNKRILKMYKQLKYRE